MPKRTEAAANALWPYFLRRGRLLAHRLSQRLSLSQRFLIFAVVIVAIAMFGLGNWIGLALRSSITRGVATTAAGSIESLIAHQIDGLNLDEPMSTGDRAALNEVFAVGNDAIAPRLLQIRLYNLQGQVLYESIGPLSSPSDPSAISKAARDGGVTARISSFSLTPVGPIGSHPIEVLQIFAPLYRQGTNTAIAVAELFYSARPLIAIEQSAEQDVWAVVGLIGIGVISVLYLLVDRASQTIDSQRSRLAGNLVASRKLSEENRELHAASETLRVGANLANG